MFSTSIQNNKKIIKFSTIIVYVGMIFFFFLVLLSDVRITSKVFLDFLTIENFLDRNNIAPLLTVAGTIFAYFSIVIISFGDFSRYIKKDVDLNKGNLSLILNLIIFSIFSTFIVRI